MAKAKNTGEPVEPTTTVVAPAQPPAESTGETTVVAPAQPPATEPAEKKGPGYYWVGVREDSRYQTIQAASLNWAVKKQLVSASALYLEELKTNEYLEVTPAEE